jgi:hypothetical protein
VLAPACCSVDRGRARPAEAVTRDAAGGAEAHGERQAVRPGRWVCAGCGNQLALGDRFCSICGRAVEASGTHGGN